MPLSQEQIIASLGERFEGLDITVQRERRLWVETDRKAFREVLSFIHDELGFIQLCTITGLDLGDRFQLIYHLAADGGQVLNLKQSAPRGNPTFETCTEVYKGAVLYELEVKNLLGLNIKGIPEDVKYPLPDNWPAGQYPLRKDWEAPLSTDEKKKKE